MLRLAATVLLLAGLLCAGAAAQTLSVHVQSLAGPTSAIWTVSNQNGSVSVQTALPNYALGALQEHGVINDPLYRHARGRTEYFSACSRARERSFPVCDTAALQTAMGGEAPHRTVSDYVTPLHRKGAAFWAACLSWQGRHKCSSHEAQGVCAGLGNRTWSGCGARHGILPRLS